MHHIRDFDSHRAIESRINFLGPPQKQVGLAIVGPKQKSPPIVRRADRRYVYRLFSFFSVENFVEQSGQSSAHKRSNDEHPNLGKGSRVLIVDEGGEGRRDAAGRVDRGAGQIDADEVDEGEGEPDHDSRDLAVSCLFVGDVKDDVDEDEGQNDFGDQRPEDATGSQFTRIADRVVAGIASGGEASHLEDSKYQDRAEESADDLRANVDQEFLEGHALGEQAAKGDRGVDVAAADATDRIGHRNDGKAKGQGRGD